MTNPSATTLHQWLLKHAEIHDDALSTVNRNGQQTGNKAFQINKMFRALHMRCIWCGHRYLAQHNLAHKTKCPSCQDGTTANLRPNDGSIIASTLRPIILNDEQKKQGSALVKAIAERDAVDKAKERVSKRFGETILREDGFLPNTNDGLLAPTDADIDEMAAAVRAEYLSLTGVTAQPFDQVSKPTKDAWRQCVAAAFSKRRKQVGKGR